MTPADVSRFCGPGTYLEPLWRQSMIGHHQDAIEMVTAATIGPADESAGG